MEGLTPSFYRPSPNCPWIRQDPALGASLAPGAPVGEQLLLQPAAGGGGAVGAPMGLRPLSVLAHLSPSFPRRGVAGGWDLGISRINDICSEVSGSRGSTRSGAVSEGKSPVTGSSDLPSCK